MVKLVESISEAAREVLETFINEDLLGAVVTESLPVIDDDGKIFISEIILRLENGRKVAIVPEMRGNCPWLTLEIYDGEDWRGMTVEDDYVEEMTNDLVENRKV